MKRRLLLILIAITEWLDNQSARMEVEMGRPIDPRIIENRRRYARYRRRY